VCGRSAARGSGRDRRQLRIGRRHGGGNSKMNFTAWAHSHARSILFLLGAFALAGAFASFPLPVALFPQVSFPRVRITLDAGDRPAEQMAVEVTKQVEDNISAIT